MFDVFLEVFTFIEKIHSFAPSPFVICQNQTGIWVFFSFALSFNGTVCVCIYKIEFCIQKRCETHVLNKRARVFRDSILCTSMHGVCYSHRLYIRHRWSIFQYTRNVHVICDILHSTTDTMHERMCVGKRPKRAMCSFLYEEFHLADLPCVSPIWIAYKTFELSDDLWTQNIFKWFGNLPDIYTMHRCAWELTPPPSPLEL